MSIKSISLLAVFFAFIRIASAQDYIVQGVTPDLHLSHKVASKETWYSISRTYNLMPKDIAVYNKLSVTKPLEIGQQVKVPLLPSNFSQDNEKSASEAFVPVYHVVQPKEWLYRISVNHNKVPVANLEKWNTLKKDGAVPGMKLIVGYLKVKDAHATLASKAREPVVEKSTEAKRPEPENKTEQQENTGSTDNTPNAVAETKPANSGKENSYFKSLYNDGGKTTSGITGLFKSTSGWKDGKYYALISNVPVGTIIRVTFPQTGKTIYGKVLGELPEMKESAGLLLRISDAAVYELGASDSKFSVDIAY